MRRTRSARPICSIANAKRRGNGNGDEERAKPSVPTARTRSPRWQLDEARIEELARSAEEFLLTVTDTGFGKRSSAYEYRVTGRGGQGIANITLAPRNGTAVVATFPVRPRR